MKRCIIAAAVVALSFVGLAEIRYAAPDGTGDGLSWSSPASATTAIGLAQTGDEVWFKKGVYTISAPIETANAVTLRGGFEGTEGAASERSAAGWSVFDGETTSAILKFTCTVAGETVTLDRLELARASTHAIEKTGASNLTLFDCKLTDNGYEAAVQGRGILMKGSAASTVLTVENCEFVRNAAHVTSENKDETGGAGYIQDCAHIYLHDCDFRQNGILPNLISNCKLPGRDNTYGYTLMLKNAPLTANACRFIGNIGCVHAGELNGRGATLLLSGSCGGSSFTNCAWAANSSLAWNAGVYNTHVKSGTVAVNLDSATSRVDFSNCTFAYNIMDGKTCVGGISAIKGDIYVRSSIFYGNMVRKIGDSTDRSCDIFVESSQARVDVDYTLFGLTGVHSAGCASGVSAEKLVLGSSVIYGDPLFATDWDTMAGKLAANVGFDKGTGLLTATSPQLPTYQTDAVLTNVDLHVDETSSTVDTGDPVAPYAREPLPNGDCVNMGFYGNTPDAQVTVRRLAEITSAGSVQANYTYRLFTVALGGEGDYSAEVKLCYGATDAREGGTWDVEEVLSADAHPGAVLEGRTKIAYQPGSTLYWKVIATTRAGSVEESGDVTVTGELPPNYGKGGGANVIHVWDGACGLSDGSDWLNAVRTFEEALALVGGSRTNIWIAGTVRSGETGTLTVPAAVRGGFTAMESAASERPADGSMASIDGNEINDCVVLSASSGVFSFERVRLMRAFKNALTLSGGASLEMCDSEVFDNGYLGKDYKRGIKGRGLNLAGVASESSVTLKNVRFAANMTHFPATTVMGAAYEADDGCAILANGFSRVLLEDCLFVTNGLAAWQSGIVASGCEVTCGWVVDIQNAPIVARRCEFRGNRYLTYKNSSMIRLGSGCGGSVFENCVFAGNCGARRYSNSWQDCVTGCVNCDVGLAQTVAFRNCTFAYNLSDNGRTACLFLNSGAVTVKDSVFYANLVEDKGDSFDLGADLWVQTANAKASVSYSMFGSLAKPHLGTAAGCASALELVTGNTSPDSPRFATDIVDVTNLVDTAKVGLPLTASPFEWKTGVDPSVFDVHPKSQGGRWTPNGLVEDAVTSPAVDGGDPTAAYDGEPSPNGGRLNAGAYGNTSEASRSVPIAPELASVVAAAGTYTHIKFTVTLSDKVQPSARLVLCYGLSRPDGDDPWEREETITLSTQAGGVYEAEEKLLYPAGSTVYWRVVAAAGDLTDAREGSSVTVGEMPASYGKGGGARVIHVRPAAESVGTGADWASGFATVAEALAQVTPERSTIWICGNIDFDGAEIDRPMRIVGGFAAGTECSEAERSPGARSVLDCRTSADGFVFSHAEGTVRLDDVEVRRAKMRGVRKEGAGSIELVGCRFYDNGYNDYLLENNKSLNGRGVQLLGVAGVSTALVERCVFERNEAKNTVAQGSSNVPYDDESGTAAYVKDFAALTIRNCDFVDNGVMRGQVGVSMPGRESTKAWVLHVENAPCVMTGSRFVGNRACCHGEGLVAAVTGSPLWMTNCLWAANGGSLWNGTSSRTGTDGTTLLLTPGSGGTGEVVNCTFAYNALTCESAGLRVASGTVVVRDSIFWGNLIGKEIIDQSVGADLYSTSGAKIVCDHCLVAGDAAPYASGALTLTNRVAGDPLFVTTTNEVKEALYSSKNEFNLPGVGGNFYYKADADLASFNLHVRGRAGYIDETTGKIRRFAGVQSPAIDSGTPKDPRRFLEPAGSTRGLNLGFYGGTPYATRTGVGFVLIVR